MRNFVATLTFGLSVILSGSALAQEPPKPGPEHAKLKEMVGTWETTTKSPAGDSKGTMTYKMELGGLWLIEDYKGEFGGVTFSGHGLNTYDAAKKKYVTIWVDSTSTDFAVMEGNFDKDGKVQTMVGDMPGPDGKKMKVTMITEYKDKDNKVMTMRAPGPDGKDFDMMVLTFRRKS